MPVYRYALEELTGSAFRIVRLCEGAGDDDVQCELIHAFLDDDTLIPYEALSYVWGSRENMQHIYIGQSEKEVTANLHKALRRLRHPTQDRYLWVDALCINQFNHDEVAHQIHRMRKIYKKAERVIIWLGDECHYNSTVLMAELQHFSSYTKGRTFTMGAENTPGSWWNEAKLRFDSSHNNNLDRKRAGLRACLENEWFRRGWIIQEVANAKRATIYYGTHSISSTVFALGPKLLDCTIDPYDQAILDIMAPKKPAWLSEGNDLYRILHRFPNANTTLARDKIFALLGLCEEQSVQAVPVDYDSPEDEFAKEAIKAVYGCSPSATVLEGIFASTGTDQLLSDPFTLGDKLLHQTIQTSDAESVDILLRKTYPAIAVTREIIVLAINNLKFGVEMMSILFQHRAAELKISEDLLLKIMAREEDSDRMLDVIVEKVQKKIKCTTGLIIKASQHQESRKGKNRLLNQLLRDATRFDKVFSGFSSRAIENNKDATTVLDAISWWTRCGSGHGTDRKLLHFASYDNKLSAQILTSITKLYFRKGTDESDGTFARTDIKASIEDTSLLVAILLDAAADKLTADREHKRAADSVVDELLHMLGIEKKDSTQERWDTARDISDDHLREVAGNISCRQQVFGWLGRFMLDNPTYYHSLAFMDSVGERSGGTSEETVDGNTSIGKSRLWIGKSRPIQVNLISAVRLGFSDIADRMLDDMISSHDHTALDLTDSSGCTALCHAVIASDEKIVSRLLKSSDDINVNSVDDDGRTILSYAYEFASVGIIEELLERGAKVKIRWYDASEPDALWYASKRARFDVMEKLLDAGATSSVISEMFLQKLVRADQTSCLQHFLNMAPEIAQWQDDHERTALSHAAETSDFNTIEILLQAGAAVEVADDRGRTPLLYASQRRQAGVMERLIAAGADIERRDKHGRTALSHAAHMSALHNIGILLDQGAAINSADEKGFTPLFYASESWDVKVVETLIEANADLNWKDNTGHTALSISARWQSRLKIVERLLESGARADISDENGLIPEDIARQANCKEIVELLRGWKPKGGSQKEQGA